MSDTAIIVFFDVGIFAGNADGMKTLEATPTEDCDPKENYITVEDRS